VSLLLAFATAAALAQDPPNEQDYTVDIERFRPAADTFGYGVVQSATTLDHLQLGVGLWGNYSDDPLVLVWEGERVLGSDENGDGIIDNRAMADLQVGIGLSPYFSLTIDAPVVLWQQGFDPASADNPNLNPELVASGISDIRVTPKIAMIDLDKYPIGVAIMSELDIPMNNGGSFLSEEEFSAMPMMAVEVADKSVRNREYVFRAAGNVGFRVREVARFRDLVIHNEFRWGGAMAIHPAEPIEFGVELDGAVGGPRPAHRPTELRPFFKVIADNLVVLTTGAGFGLNPGLGSPDYRVFMGATIAPEFDPASLDRDKDGIANKFDICIADPEDLDNYLDDDGCPEPDNDKDGVLDSEDRCPNDPEDDDGYRDHDGCPDVDNDKDGILDMADRCPDQPETFNEYQDTDGCPDDEPIYDTDGDGYLDDVDRCPYDPEDFDGVEDEDGCPDTSVQVVSDQIKINDTIHFEYNRAVIQEISFDLLNDIAALLRERTDLLKVRIEGHTDGDGDDVYNLKLSQQRADSVKAYLVNAGIDAGRLDPIGFGEMRPVADNSTDEGKAANRRVEFIIVDRAQ
jgi:outer membrane protein OmpA-like peptidoglycan-associated protein